jgi:hypothetical protein
VVVLAAVGVAAVGAAWLWPVDCSFDADAWASARRADFSAKFEAMSGEVRTLVECDKLGGLTRGQVRNLLGRPDHVLNDKGRYVSERGRLWTYGIGVPDLHSDYPSLEVKFGQSGRVTRAHVPGD